MTNTEIYEQALQKNKYDRRPGSIKCPVCKADSPACQWDEVDIGIGVRFDDERFVCLEHGVFDLDNVFRDLRFSA